MADDWLQKFAPNNEGLFDLLNPQVDDDMLWQIASADYGRDVKAHVAPLRSFRDSRLVPVLEWHPCEVLELIRWSQPDQAGWLPGDEGRRGHLLRAFACATLLRSYAAPENERRWISLNETAINLVESVEALGADLMAPAASFFAWCVERLVPLDPGGFEGTFLGLSLLRLAVQVPNSPDDAVIGLCQWIDQRVSALLQKGQWWAEGERHWLLSIDPQIMDKDRWIAVGRALYRQAERLPLGETTTWVALIGRSLAED